MDCATPSNSPGAAEHENAVDNSSPRFAPPIKSDQLPTGKKLTKDLVLSKSKGGSLIEIKKIVVWGQKITDCSIVTEIPELEVASMNANKISSLEHFGQCPNLRELFLRSNCIEDLDEIYHLKDLPNLQILWLAGNPCTKHPKYRSTVIRNLEQLQKLDDTEISPAERASCDSEGLLFEEPPAKSAADPEDGAIAAATDPLPVDLADRMRPAEDAKQQESSTAPLEASKSTAESSTAHAAQPDDAAGSSVQSGDIDSSEQSSFKAATTASPVPSETSANATSTSTAAPAPTLSASRLTGTTGAVAPLPRYALTEVRTAVLRLIRLLDQESLQLVMHTVRARLQEGSDQQQQQQVPQQQTSSSNSDISQSFSLDNL